MTLTTWVPWLLAFGNVLSALLVGKGQRKGWVVMMLTQPAFVCYALLTGQPGFMLQNVAMQTIASHNYLSWSAREM